MDCNLSEFPQANAFIDDILVVTKGTEIDHIGTVEKFLKKIDEEIISLKLTKVNFFQRECEWLGHRITPTGVTPLITEPMEALKPPRTLLQLKKFTGSIHSLHRYLPASAKSSAKITITSGQRNAKTLSKIYRNKLHISLNFAILIFIRIKGLYATQVITV